MLAASAALAFSDDEVVVVSVPVVAIAGGALAGSWWALTLAAIPALLAWASDDPWAWLYGTAAIAIAFAFLAVGVALDRYARIPPRALTVGSITTLALVIAAAAVSGSGNS